MKYCIVAIALFSATANAVALDTLNGGSGADEIVVGNRHIQFNGVWYNLGPYVYANGTWFQLLRPDGTPIQDGDDITINGNGGDDYIDALGSDVSFVITQQHIFNPLTKLIYFTINGGSGNDDLNGSDFVDFINGGSGEDDIDGYDSPDDLRGGTEYDTIAGGAGEDLILGNSITDCFENNVACDQPGPGTGICDTCSGGDDDDVVMCNFYTNGGLGTDTCWADLGPEVQCENIEVFLLCGDP